MWKAWYSLVFKMRITLVRGMPVVQLIRFELVPGSCYIWSRIALTRSRSAVGIPSNTHYRFEESLDSLDKLQVEAHHVLLWCLDTIEQPQMRYLWHICNNNSFRNTRAACKAWCQNETHFFTMTKSSSIFKSLEEKRNQSVKNQSLNNSKYH